MAIPQRGAWINGAQNLQPYATAQIWGTGVNPIHEMYGEGPPLRVTGREGLGGEISPAIESPSEVNETDELWGYEQPGEYVGGDNTVYYDDRPAWNEVPPDYRGRTDGHPPWNGPRSWSEMFRGRYGGAHRTGQKLVDGQPSETVTEGWRNKAKSYQEDAVVSDPSQYEVQTSMQRRNQVVGNMPAQERGTDEPRTPIHSRIRGMKLKIYSGEERHYDMFPYQQDEMLRPFWYRQAGTGNPDDMAPNEMTLRSPVRRVPPNDPSMGPQETDLEGNDFGYTPEDTFYA